MLDLVAGEQHQNAMRGKAWQTLWGLGLDARHLRTYSIDLFIRSEILSLTAKAAKREMTPKYPHKNKERRIKSEIDKNL